MPRKSSAATLTRPVVSVAHNRVQARPETSAEIRDVFSELVRSQPPQHFRQCDADLLERYCEAVILSREAFKELQLGGSVSADGRLSPWIAVLEKSHRSAAGLAAKLRLCPSARLSAKSAERAKPPRRGKPIWEVD
jgi:hypothetical protein